MTLKVKANQVKKALKKVIIVTGPSGAGKSGVALWLSRRGWKLHDVDAIAKTLYEPGTPAFRAIVRVFGAAVVAGTGEIDRALLAQKVFKSSVARRRLNGILFPPLIRRLKVLAKNPGKHCFDMAVYFSAGAPKLRALVLIIDAPLTLRIKRLNARYHDSRRARLQAKALKFGAAEHDQADAVIFNSGTRAGLNRAITIVLKALL